MNQMQTGPLAERELKIGEKSAVICLDKPEATDGDFICRYEIRYDKLTIKRKALGLDAFQAILLALAGIREELLLLEDKTGKRIIWLDNICGYRGFPELPS